LIFNEMGSKLRHPVKPDSIIFTFSNAIMDILTDIMPLLRTSTHLYGRLDLRAPFAFRLPGGKGICIIVTQGSCFLGVDNEASVSLIEGDFVLLPTPQFYSLSSDPRLPLRSVEQISSSDEFRRSRRISFDGGEGSVTSLIAGCFTWESPESKLLVEHLPPVVHLQASGNHAAPWFHSTVQFIALETSQNLPGGTAIVDRLAEVLFIQAMRIRMDSFNDSAHPSWLRALSHPQIGDALRRMHAEPEREWTVVDLARSVSMSRSSFAAQFRQLVGESPLDHLTQWRMARAANMMRATRPIKLAAIASAVGYKSESAFAKAFRRVMGQSPGKYNESKDGSAGASTLRS
jgi:AraC-like DNA-binding protein